MENRILPAENEQVVCKLIYKGVSAPADTVHCSRCDVRILIGSVPNYCPHCGAQFDIYLDESAHHEPRDKELRAESTESRLAEAEKKLAELSAIVEPLRELWDKRTKVTDFYDCEAENEEYEEAALNSVSRLAALVPPVEKEK